MSPNYQEFNHKLKNFIHTLVLFLAMGSILSLLGFIVAGVTGILWAVSLGFLILIISPNLPPAFIFSLYGAKLIPASDAPALYQITQELAARANLPRPPELFYLPSQIMNAFSVGTRDNSGIGMSYALLNSLTLRELIGVLAHETSHIQNNDVRLMSYADIISRIINTLSLTGFLMVFFTLPLFFWGQATISWPALGILLLAPTLMSNLQLSLSRMRELEADRQAVLLTGDPEGLAMALNKIERYESALLDLLSRSGHGATVPSILRTHPDIETRITYLLSLKTLSQQALASSSLDRFSVPSHYQKLVKPPRWHANGFWY